ncbi:hypothetical protein H6G17_26155 [Chroococcidiopsis sp. FACHB-1243]|uniref:hypothetical protein n=1 Tax=Chroococcidiopsis sp. [FACHB-1243] TaxID=2692781 RepID=UPI001780852A|nr:hypothetical protein [Chroococcidiopsis sp. [FACHB-1243]]MBD2308955.1 hypothetical protein [Chroococcidiopsis sp. [FACHB-1243]]
MSQEQQAVTQSVQTAASLAQKYGVELGAELSAELASPTEYYPPQDDPGYIPNFYENDLWMNVQPREQAKPVDTRPQQEIAYEQYLIQKQKAEQPQEQAEQVQGANARLVASSLEYGWETPTFQAYLDSDDDAYMSMRLSPQQLQLANEVWGLDEDTAKAYVYHHKLTTEDLALIEMAFTGKQTPKPQLPTDQRDEYVKQQQPLRAEDDDYDAEDTSEPSSLKIDPAPDYTAALDSVNYMRRVYFSQASDAEWSSILNDCIDEFESLSPLEREPYDNPAGLWALHQRVSYRRQQAQAQKQAQQRQQPSRLTNDNPRGSSKRNIQGFSNSALTKQGKLKQSWINSLSNVDYGNNADRITAWYARGLVDRNA